jgi:hypothetical protein
MSPDFEDYISPDTIGSPETAERNAQDENKPLLFIDNANPHETVAELRDILTEAGGLYDRGIPVRLAFDQMQQGMVVQVMKAPGIVRTAHTVCRPLQNRPKERCRSRRPSAELLGNHVPRLAR